MQGDWRGDCRAGIYDTWRKNTEGAFSQITRWRWKIMRAQLWTRLHFFSGHNPSDAELQVRIKLNKFFQYLFCGPNSIFSKNCKTDFFLLMNLCCQPKMVTKRNWFAVFIFYNCFYCFTKYIQNKVYNFSSFLSLKWQLQYSFQILHDESFCFMSSQLKLLENLIFWPCV